MIVEREAHLLDKRLEAWIDYETACEEPVPFTEWELDEGAVT